MSMERFFGGSALLGAIRRPGRAWKGAPTIVLMVALFAGEASAQVLFGRAEDVIPPELETMYLKGLKYLVSSQTADGNWGDNYGNQPGVVGLAVLAMLAHGEDPNSGPYSAAIKRGLDFILRSGNSRTGYIGSSMYNHGFATLALAEAYGAVDDPRIGPALRRAVDLIVTAQTHNGLGGWRYSPESTDADTTVTGAQFVALLAARNAGLAVPEETIQKGLQFFTRCQTAEGGFGYTDARGPNNPRTAIGALAFALARQKDQTFKGAMDFLGRDPYRDDNYPYYYHYYASQAFFHADPELWTGWNHRNIRQLAAMQQADGSWEGNHGAVFSTSMALLSLALNYRYLPIYER